MSRTSTRAPTSSSVRGRSPRPRRRWSLLAVTLPCCTRRRVHPATGSTEATGLRYSDGPVRSCSRFRVLLRTYPRRSSGMREPSSRSMSPIMNLQVAVSSGSLTGRFAGGSRTPTGIGPRRFGTRTVFRTSCRGSRPPNSVRRALMTSWHSGASPSSSASS